MQYALDCITTVESTAACYAAIGRGGGKYVALNVFSRQAANRQAVAADWILGPTIFGQGSTWPPPYGRNASQEVEQFGTKLFSIAQSLLEQGKLKHHPLRILDGGLEGALDGLKMVEEGNVSAEKIVVRFP